MIVPTGPDVVSGGGARRRREQKMERLLRTPSTPLTRMRLLSPWCAAIDRLLVACGSAVVLLALVSSVWSWTDDRTLIAPGTLEGTLGWLIAPGWIWMIGSMFALKGLRRENTKESPPSTLSTSTKVALAFVGIVIVASIARSSQLGMSEGSLRNPAPGIYLVDAENNAEGWTVVSNDEYQRWSAIFVRGLTPLALFGLVIVGVGLNFLGMHRMALEAEQATDVGMGPSVGGPVIGGPYRL